MTLCGILQKARYNSCMGKIREDKLRPHRIIQIDRLIRSGSYPSLKELIAKFEVSKRTILRDLEFLRDRYDAPLECDRSLGGYYYTDPSFMVQNVLLTEGDLFTISTIMPLLEQYKNTPLENSFKSIMTKIVEMLPEQVTVDTSFLNNDVSISFDPLPKIEESVFVDVFKAVKTRSVINFLYKSSKSQSYKERVFEVYHVACRNGVWYAIGFDKNAGAKGQGQLRNYALHRMKNIKIQKEKFTLPKDFDYKKIDNSFGVWRNEQKPIDFEIQFSPSAANYVLEREWHEDQESRIKKDGSVILRFKSNQFERILSWALSFGSDATVLKPARLKNEMRRVLNELSAKYS